MINSLVVTCIHTYVIYIAYAIMNIAYAVLFIDHGGKFRGHKTTVIC